VGIGVVNQWFPSRIGNYGKDYFLLDISLVQDLSIVNMGDIDWQDMKNILHRHEEASQKNNKALQSINAKLVDLE
jgi:hypothetical protein